MASKNYVNNKRFSDELIAYKKALSESNDPDSIPIPDYVGECIMEIATRLGRKPNFMNYTYIDDMIMDAVENCIRELEKFDHTRPTRTGKVNAFGYFTQICIYAFLRRIQKEKRQSEIKETIKRDAGANSFAISDSDDNVLESIVHGVRQRQFYEEDSQDKVEPIKFTKRKKHYKLPSTPDPTPLDSIFL